VIKEEPGPAHYFRPKGVKNPNDDKNHNDRIIEEMSDSSESELDMMESRNTFQNSKKPKI
jgi:hypothetical protein